jgi:tRNA pseudouridine38-40 synthase
VSDAPPIDAPIDALASDPATPLRKLSAVVEYDGAGFSGWQTQADRRTVQQTLESALSEMCEEPIRVRAASRTDAGVHARGQVVVFRTHRHNIPRHGFERGLNARLPDDVAVRRVTDVEDTWDPRGQARGKQYRYSLWNDRVPTALERGRSWWIKSPLDLELLQAAADQFVGTHDFEAFRAAGCPSPHAVRTLYSVTVRRGERSMVHIDLVGNAFCRNQVRIMVGTLREIGGGRRPLASIARALASLRRADAGITAPPQGLCLEEVIYDDRLPPKPKSTRTAAEALAAHAGDAPDAEDDDDE